jgi:hypothetical protein
MDEPVDYAGPSSALVKAGDLQMQESIETCIALLAWCSFFTCPAGL